MHIASLQTKTKRKIIVVLLLSFHEYNGHKYTPSFIIATLRDMIAEGSEIDCMDLRRAFSPTLVPAAEITTIYGAGGLVLCTNDHKKEVAFITFVDDIPSL
jgi:hypothetical protein